MTAKMGRFPFFYHLMRLFARPMMRASYPAEGWDMEWVEVSSDAVAFNIHRCFYLEILTSYGAAELTSLYCWIDDLLFDGVSPQVRWERSKTLARGDDCCTFRFVRIR